MTDLNTPQPTGFSEDDEPMRVDAPQGPVTPAASGQEPIKVPDRGYTVLPRDGRKSARNINRVQLSPRQLARIDEQHKAQEQNFINVMYTVSKNDPEFEAKVRKLGANFDGQFSKESIRQNLPAFQRAWQMRKVENLDLKQSAPMLYQDLTNLEFAAVAYDLVEPLSVFEGIWGDLRHDWLLNERNKLAAAFTGGVPGALAAGAGQDLENIKQVLGGTRKISDKDWHEFSKTIDELDEELRQLPSGDNYFTPFFRFTGQQAETLVSSAGYMAAGAAAGFAAGAISGPGSAFTAIGGATYGLSTGYAMNSYLVNSGGAYIGMRQAGISHETARRYSIATGVGSTIAEMAGAKLLTGSASLISPKALKETLKKFKGQGGFEKVDWKMFAGEWAKRSVIGAAGETGTEMAQTAIEIGSAELARQTDAAKGRVHPETGEPLSSSWQEGQFWSEIGETALYTAQAMSIMAPLTGGFRARSRYKIAKKEVQKTQEVWKAIGENAKDLAERDPDAAAQHIAKRLKDTPYDHLQVDLRDLQRVLGEIGLTEDQILELVPDAQRAMKIAAEHPDMAVDVTVETGKFMSEVITRPKVYNALAPVIRAEGDFMSLEQLQVEQQALHTATDELLTAADKADESIDSGTEVVDEGDDQPEGERTTLQKQVQGVTARLRDQLSAAGVFGAEQRAQLQVQRAMLMRHYMNSQMEGIREGGLNNAMPFDEWFDNFGYQVQASVPTARSPAATSDRQLTTVGNESDVRPINASEVQTVDEVDALIAKAEERQAAEQQEAEAAPEAETEASEDADQERTEKPFSEVEEQRNRQRYENVIKARIDSVTEQLERSRKLGDTKGEAQQLELLADYKAKLNAASDSQADAPGADVKQQQQAEKAFADSDRQIAKATEAGDDKAQATNAWRLLSRAREFGDKKREAQALQLIADLEAKGYTAKDPQLLDEDDPDNQGQVAEDAEVVAWEEGEAPEGQVGPWVVRVMRPNVYKDGELVQRGQVVMGEAPATEAAPATQSPQQSEAAADIAALQARRQEILDAQPPGPTPEQQAARDNPPEWLTEFPELAALQDGTVSPQQFINQVDARLKGKDVPWSKMGAAMPELRDGKQLRYSGKGKSKRYDEKRNKKLVRGQLLKQVKNYAEAAGLWTRPKKSKGGGRQATILTALRKGGGLSEAQWRSAGIDWDALKGELRRLSLVRRNATGRWSDIALELKNDGFLDAYLEAGDEEVGSGDHEEAFLRAVNDALAGVTVVGSSSALSDAALDRMYEEYQRSQAPQNTDDVKISDEDFPLFQDDGNFEQGDYEFDESEYRPEVVAWAKEEFGDRVAPNGKPVWQNFVRWFGDSQVVDAEGKPLQSLHHTRGDEFSKFSHEEQMKARREALVGEGSGYTTRYGLPYVFPEEGFFFFVRNPDYAAGDTPGIVRRDARSIPAYLSIQNPLDLTQNLSPEEASAAIRFLQANVNRDPSPGHAGFRLKGGPVDGLRRARSEGITPQQLWDLISHNSFTDRGKLWDQLLAALGKDGLLMEVNSSGTSMLEPQRGPGDGETYVAAVALDPNQIKSTNNKGDFSADERILYQHSTSLRRKTRTLKKYGLDPKKKYKTREVAAALEARTRAETGGIDRDDRSDEAVRKIAKWMVEEVLFEMDDIGASGVAWYSRRFQTALNRASKIYPELKKDKQARNTATLLIALTSDGTKPDENFNIAMGIYKGYRKNGKLRAIKGSARGATMAAHLRKVEQMFAKFGVAKTHKILMSEDTISNLSKLAKSMGLKFKGQYQAHIVMPMATVFLGPKLGAFYANLMGAHGYLTMDRWWSRTVNRYRGLILANPTESSLENFRKLLRKPRLSDDETIAATVSYRADYEGRNFKTRLALLVGRSEPTKATDKAKWMATAKRKAGKRFTRMLNEHNKERTANTIYKQAFENLEDAPFNLSDRTFMLKAVNQAQKNLALRGHKMTIADIQAVLWYYEKKLYGELGAPASGKIAYDEAARLWVASETEGRDGQPVRKRNARKDGKAGGGNTARLGEEEYRPEGVDRPALYQDDGRPELDQEGALPDFYSALAQETAALPAKSMKASAWKQALKGLVNKGKVKQDEIGWSGIEDWLDLQEGKVTKEEVQAYLEASGVKVEMRDEKTEPISQEYQDAKANYEKKNLEWQTVLNFHTDAADAAGSREISDAARVEIHDARMAMNQAEDAMYASEPDAPRPGMLQYKKYTLPLGAGTRLEGYREMVMTLPRMPGLKKPLSIQLWDERAALLEEMEMHSLREDQREAYADYLNAAKQESLKHEELLEIPVAQRRQDRRDWDRHNKRFTHGHWERLNNPLAHIRTSDFVGADGKRYLVVHEVQSDWGQEGRNDGFEPSMKATLVKERSTDGQDEKVGPIPRAPFVTSTKGWLNLALKKLVMVASGEGYDRISFIDGDSAATLYGLSQHVSEMRAVLSESQARVDQMNWVDREIRDSSVQKIGEVVNDKGELEPRYRVRDSRGMQLGFVNSLDEADALMLPIYREAASTILKVPEGAFKNIEIDLATSDFDYSLVRLTVDKDGAVLETDRTDLKGKALKDIVGQDVANKLLDPGDGGRPITLEGEDLKVGGKGMKGFYDEILPQAAKKMVKKLGGETTQADVAGIDSAFTIELTSKMRGQVAEGLPLFSDGRKGPDGQYRRMVDEATGRVRRVISLLSADNPTTLIHESAHLFLDARIDLLREQLTRQRQASSGDNPFAAGEVTISATLLIDMENLFDSLKIGDSSMEMLDRIAIWDSMPWPEVRVRHEAVARNFERYLMLGVTPSKELESAFRQISTFMKAWYRDASLINEQYKAAESLARSKEAGKPVQFTENLFELSDGVREIFARMMASDEDVQKEANRIGGIFGLGHGDREDEEIKNAAAAEVAQKLIQDGVRQGLIHPGRINERVGREARKIRRAVMKQVLAKLRLQPVYRLREFLSTGRVVTEEGEDLGVDDVHKINTEDMRQFLNGSGISVQSLGAITSPAGRNINEIRSLYGYESITDMVAELRTALPLRDAAKQETTNRMKDEFSDLATPMAIQNTVRAAIAGEAGQREIISQIEEVLGKRGDSGVTLQAAQQVARSRIRNLTMRELQPRKFEESARRNRKLARQRWKDGDIQGAVEAYRAELVDTATVRQVSTARVSMENGARKMSDMFRQSKDRARAKTRDTRYLAMGRLLLSYVGLGPNVKDPQATVNTLQKRDKEFFAAISSYLAPIEAINQARLADPVRSRQQADFMDLTWNQFEMVSDIANLLWDRAKSSKFGYLNRRKIDRDEVAKDLLAVLESTGRLEEYQKGEVAERIDNALSWFTRIEHAMMQLDGGVRGLWWRTVYKPVRDAFDRSERLKREHLIELRKHLDAVNKLAKKDGMPQEIATDPENGEFGNDKKLPYKFGVDSYAGKSPTHEIVALLVNLGTQSNRDRTILGRGWGEIIGKDGRRHADMKPMMQFLNRLWSQGLLTEEHVNLANEITKTYEDILPSFQAATMEIEGIYANEIEAIPLVIGSGETALLLNGGYVPVKYAPSSDTENKKQTRQVDTGGLYFGSSATKDRIDGFADKISLRLTDTMLAFQEHIRYAEIAPVAKQVRDLLDVGVAVDGEGGRGTETIGQVLRRTNPGIWGLEGSSNFKADNSAIYIFLNRATTGKLGPIKEPGNWSSFWRSLRNNYGVIKFSFDVKNSAENLGALTQAAALIGSPKWIGWGYRHQDADLAVYGPRGENQEPLYEINSFMANRLAEGAQQVIATDLDPSLKDEEWQRNLQYVLPAWTQKIVDRVVWSGAYGKWMAEDRTAETSDADAHEQAQEYANATVRILNSGDIIDQGNYEGMFGEFARNMTQWFSWANGQQNLTKTLWVKTMREGGLGNYAGATAGLLGRFLWRFLTHHYVMYTIGGMISEMVRGIPDDEEDLERYMIDALLVEPLKFTGHAMAPVVGDMAMGQLAKLLGNRPFDPSKVAVISMVNQDMDDLTSLDAGTVKAFAQLAYLFRGFMPKGLSNVAAVAALAGRQLDYAAENIAGNVEPTGIVDAVRGAATGRISPESKRR